MVFKYQLKIKTQESNDNLDDKIDRNIIPKIKEKSEDFIDGTLVINGIEYNVQTACSFENIINDYFNYTIQSEIAIEEFNDDFFNGYIKTQIKSSVTTDANDINMDDGKMIDIADDILKISLNVNDLNITSDDGSQPIISEEIIEFIKNIQQDSTSEIVIGNEEDTHSISFSDGKGYITMKFSEKNYITNSLPALRETSSDNPNNDSFDDGDD